MIKFTDVSLYRDGQAILKDISFTIKAREKVALIGPSGAGKTSLLNILSRQVVDFSGTVVVEGLAIEQYTSNRHYADCVGIIHQSYDLIDELSVQHNILSGKLREWGVWTSLRLLLRRRAHDDVLRILAAVNLQGFADKRAKLLSGGERQRVAIGRLLAQDPKIFLADEPIAALDPRLAGEILALLLQSADDKTLLASLHQVDDAKRCFQRVIALKNGRLFADVAADQLTDNLIGDLYADT